MPAYHSAWNDAAFPAVGGCKVLPLRVGPRGPAPVGGDEFGDKIDIVDEAIDFYRANVLFKTYEVKGEADRVLLYLTLFVQLMVKSVVRVKTRAEGERVLMGLGTASRFTVPGEGGFPASGMYPAIRGADSERLRAYLKQLREETAKRLIGKLFTDDGPPNKFWIAFAKRKFMNMEIRG